MKILRYIRLWRDAVHQLDTQSVEKFRDIEIGFRSGFALVVTETNPFSYSVVENHTGAIQFPYMLSVLNFDSRNELDECVHKAIEAYCRETGRFDVRVTIHSKADDSRGLRAVMVVSDISDNE